MASQIMSKVLETEKECEQRIQKAKALSQEACDKAEKQAELIIEQAKNDAKKITAEILAQAQKQADNTLEAGMGGSAADIAEMKKNASAREAEAVNAVVKLLLDVS